VKTEVDSAGLEHRSWDTPRLAWLAEKASPGKEASVEVITRETSFKGDGLTFDSVLAVKSEPTETGSEGLLPGALVTMTIGDSSLTRVRGKVLGLSKIAILFRGYEGDRQYSLDTLEAIVLSDEKVLNREDLALPNFPRRLTRVPGLFLAQKSSSIFIPLREVEQIRIEPSTHYGEAFGIVLIIVSAIFLAPIAFI
jgi:hypothetical protein